MGTTGISISLLLISSYFVKSLEFIQSIIPAMLIFELVGAALCKQAVKKWKAHLTKEREEKLKQDSVAVVEETELLSFEKLIQNRVIIDIDIRSKEDAIKMMCAELLKYGNISELQNILNLVLEREKLCPTGLGDEIALPHCRTSDVDYPMAVCAFLPPGESLEWESPDERGVRYVFLLVSPINDPNLHIEAMKSITSRILQEGFLDQLYETYKANDEEAS